MRLRTKLTVAFLTMLVPFVLVGFITIASNRILARTIRQMQQIARQLEAVSYLQLTVAYLPAAPNDYLSTGDPAEQARYTQAVARVEAAFTELEAIPFLMDDERALLTEARRQVAAMDESARAILALPEPVGDAGGIALMRQLDALAADLSTTTLAPWHGTDAAELAKAQSMAQAAERRTSLWLVLDAMAALLAAALMGTFLARYITRPLHELQVGAETIAGGQFDHRLDIHTGDEIEQLAHAFNQMGARLGDFYAELERRVTERTAELAASEARYRTLFDSARDGLYVLDMQGRYLDVNPAGCQLLGYSREELLAMDVFQVGARGLSPEERAQLLAQLQGMWRKGMSGYETQLVTKSGALIPVEMSITLLTYQGQEAVLGAVRDISERVRAEEALKEYSERLEEMVEERTRELREAQEQLIRQEKLAVLGTLAGGVGHELRNPLGVISNAVYYLNMVLADADETTATAKEYLELIASEVRNAAKIVSDLLDFSRIGPAEREETAVAELVARVLRKHPPPENVGAVTHIAADLPPVFVDPRQMEQVLVNLLTNAYQAMPEGGRLVIKTSEVSGKLPKSWWVALSVTDTGQGIPPENMDKLFEPLFTTKRRGIGLGLTISRNLVEANGGRIEVESEVGKGSTFTVWLPVDSDR